MRKLAWFTGRLRRDVSGGLLCSGASFPYSGCSGRLDSGRPGPPSGRPDGSVPRRLPGCGRAPALALGLGGVAAAGWFWLVRPAARPGGRPGRAGAHPVGHRVLLPCRDVYQAASP